ncbi:hypothetical protein [Glaciecola sp. SC05]|uniref:hypothetical protein n=1 Tax=Glaciecola sp. SC05 TaxID=1987355 RepID=UPI0035296C73
MSEEKWQFQALTQSKHSLRKHQYLALYKMKKENDDFDFLTMLGLVVLNIVLGL